MTLLQLSYPAFNKQLEKEAFPAPDGIHSNGIRYWKHSTVTPLLNGIQKRYIRAELQRLLKLYHTKFDQLMTEGKIPPADGIYPNGRRYWEYTTIKHLLSTTPNKNKALEAPI